MAVTKLSNSGIKTGVLKYDSMLAGNAAYDPAATWLIQRVAGTGSSGTITFSNIPQTYQHLQIRCNIVYSSTVLVRFQFNGDTGSNYARHILYGDGSTAGADASSSYTSNPIIYVGGSTGPNVAVVDIHDYASTTKYKTSRIFSGNDNNGSGYVTLMSGLWMSTSAVTSIDIISSANFASGSTFALYGFKG